MPTNRAPRCHRCRRPVTERPYRTERHPTATPGLMQPAVFFHADCETIVSPSILAESVVRVFESRGLLDAVRGGVA